MAGGETFYSILGVDRRTPEEGIRAAFRRLALRLHPDTNPDDPDAAVRFRLVRNAYSVLADRDRRDAYDAYLATSTVAGRGTGGGRDARRAASPSRTEPTDAVQIAGPLDSLRLALEHLSYVLWEIEDLVVGMTRTRSPDNDPDGTVTARLIEVLSFLDTWVLGPAGFPDYFFEARQMPRPGRATPAFGGSGHRPYVNLSDYFYNVRIRTDRFMARAGLADLLAHVRDTRVSLLDAVLETHRLACHVVSHGRKVLAGEETSIPEYEYSDSCYVT